jgi:hypothetical protein
MLPGINMLERSTPEGIPLPQGINSSWRKMRRKRRSQRRRITNRILQPRELLVVKWRKERHRMGPRNLETQPLAFYAPLAAPLWPIWPPTTATQRPMTSSLSPPKLSSTLPWKGETTRQRRAPVAL